VRVKTFDELYAELQAKSAFPDATGNTRRLLDAGVHEIGKKLVEEAAQLLYHAQVLMLASGVKLHDVYERL